MAGRCFGNDTELSDPDTGKLRFEVTVENASMRVESNEVFVWLELKSETDDQWLELTRPASV